MENVEALHTACHKAKHERQGWQAPIFLRAVEVTVDSIEFKGTEPTYDLEIDGEFPNFFANGIVVHNSRNSASSRAIPFERMIRKIDENPFIPVQFGSNQKGMQAGAEIEDGLLAINNWLHAKDDAINNAKFLANLNIHKQIVNRVVENFGYVTVICSFTSGGHNFYALRAHHMAQPEMQVLAYRMLQAQMDSVPQQLESGWHIPFGDKMPDGLLDEERLKIATARCARVSYENFDGEININSDYKLHDDLAKSGHWSPFEHCARASFMPNVRFGNFKGFIQYRTTFQNECRSKDDTDLKLILVNKPDWI
jgi:hypothetical protein